tara:strand:+ start:15691 stop:15993 length:303 start_codon:yes stop_codon:yes gene_type:complete
MISGRLASIDDPSIQFISVTVPEIGALISFCIFMASRIIHTSPSLTLDPNSTSTVTTFPGMDEDIIPLFFPLLELLFLGKLLLCPSGNLMEKVFSFTVTI